MIDFKQEQKRVYNNLKRHIKQEYQALNDLKYIKLNDGISEIDPNNGVNAFKKPTRKNITLETTYSNYTHALSVYIYHAHNIKGVKHDSGTCFTFHNLTAQQITAEIENIRNDIVKRIAQYENDLKNFQELYEQAYKLKTEINEYKTKINKLGYYLKNEIADFMGFKNDKNFVSWHLFQE